MQCSDYDPYAQSLQLDENRHVMWWMRKQNKRVTICAFRTAASSLFLAFCTIETYSEITDRNPFSILQLETHVKSGYPATQTEDELQI